VNDLKLDVVEKAVKEIGDAGDRRSALVEQWRRGKACITPWNWRSRLGGSTSWSTMPPGHAARRLPGVAPEQWHFPVG
jgi:hypothetical protein